MLALALLALASCPGTTLRLSRPQSKASARFYTAKIFRMDRSLSRSWCETRSSNLVDVTGIEPATSSLRTTRSPS